MIELITMVSAITEQTTT